MSSEFNYDARLAGVNIGKDTFNQRAAEVIENEKAHNDESVFASRENFIEYYEEKIMQGKDEIDLDEFMQDAIEKGYLEEDETEVFARLADADKGDGVLNEKEVTSLLGAIYDGAQEAESADEEKSNDSPYEKVKILRRFFENPAITTDVIVGFPQETEGEFEQTRAFLEKVRFFEMHVFKYSRRKGTVADRMPGQLTDAVKAGRSAVLLSMEARQSKEYRASYIGKEVEILTEEKKEIGGKTFWIGHTPAYVKAAVEDADGKLAPNMLCKGRVTGFVTDEIVSLNFSGK